MAEKGLVPGALRYALDLPQPANPLRGAKMSRGRAELFEDFSCPLGAPGTIYAHYEKDIHCSRSVESRCGRSADWLPKAGRQHGAADAH